MNPKKRSRKETNSSIAKKRRRCMPPLPTLEPYTPPQTFTQSMAPRNQEDNNVIIRAVADTSTASHYCKSNGVEWPPFDVTAICSNNHDANNHNNNNNNNNNNNYHPIRQSSHNSRIGSTSGSGSGSEEEQEGIKQQTLTHHHHHMELNNTAAMSGYDMNMNDEELQQQRQRHQDQYLESMPTPQNGYNAMHNGGGGGHNNINHSIHSNHSMHSTGTASNINHNRSTGTVLSTVSITHKPVAPVVNRLNNNNNCKEAPHAVEKAFAAFAKEQRDVMTDILDEMKTESDNATDFIASVVEWSYNLQSEWKILYETFGIRANTATFNDPQKQIFAHWVDIKKGEKLTAKKSKGDICALAIHLLDADEKKQRTNNKTIITKYNELRKDYNKNKKLTTKNENDENCYDENDENDASEMDGFILNNEEQYLGLKEYWSQ